DAAEAELRAARGIFIELGYEYNAARCTQRLGEICLLRGEDDQAIDHLTSARDTFKRHGALGDQLGAMQCTRMLGDVRRCQGNYDSAETLLTAALEALTKLGSRSEVANCHRSFGRLYRDQDRTREALASFESARDIYEALGWQAYVAYCNSRIRKLRNLHDLKFFTDGLRP
ncbi:hypothetical protein BKA62DRAFT_792378, partial [Auriculariales sp. MPI-PUGE-AT-0066]